MKEELESKDKEIAVLKEKYEKADFDLGISFKILTIDSDTEELNKLQELNKELTEQLNKLKGQTIIQDKEAEGGLKAVQSELEDIKKRHASELMKKNELIKALEKMNIELEAKLAQITAAEKIQRQKVENLNVVIEQNQKELIELEANKSEMQNEIRVLIVQCKEREREISQRGAFINKQQEKIEEFHNALKQIDAEKSSILQQNNRLTAILKEKKMQLSNVNLKIRELNTSVIQELKRIIEDRDRTISMLKEIVRGHNAELNLKNRDITRLKKNLGKVKSQKVSVSNKKSSRVHESEAKSSINPPILKKVEFTPEINKKALLDASFETNSPASTKIKAKVPVNYKAKYDQLIDNYLNEVHDVNYRNDSSNVRSALYQNHNIISNSPEVENRSKSLMARAEENENKSDEKTNMARHACDLKFGISEIIRRSLNRCNIKGNKPKILNNEFQLRNKKLTAKKLIFT